MAVTVCLSPNGANVYRTQGPPAGVLVGTVDGVLAVERTDGGDWAVTGRALEGLHVSSLMGVATSGSTFAGIHGGGLYRSRDGGRTWAPAAAGLIHEHVFSLAGDERDGGAVLYAGTEPANVFRSRDDGDSWELLPAVRAVPGSDDWNFPAPPFVAHVKHVTADPRDPDVLYVCVEQGALLKSTDGGATFEELFFEDAGCHLNKDTHRIVFHPADPDQLWLDGGDGIFRSADAGRTWTRVATPEMRIGYPDHLFVDPSDPDTVFVSGGGTPPNIWRQTGDARSTIACSRDGGRTWAPLGGGLPDSLAGNIEAVTMVTWPGGYGFLAGTTDGEVFMSAERGQAWSLVASGLPAVSKCVHARNLALGRQAVAAGSS
ncbi:MAG: VPS10 domain-containing protein [Acidimicrobiia bacterium]